MYDYLFAYRALFPFFSFAARCGDAGPCRTVQAIISVPVLQHYRTAGDGHHDQPSQEGRPVVRDLHEGESYCSWLTACRLYVALTLLTFVCRLPG